MADFTGSVVGFPSFSRVTLCEEKVCPARIDRAQAEARCTMLGVLCVTARSAARMPLSAEEPVSRSGGNEKEPLRESWCRCRFSRRIKDDEEGRTGEGRRQQNPRMH